MEGDPSGGLNAVWKVSVTLNNGKDAVPRVSFGNDRFEGTTPVNDGNWHYIVASYTSRTTASGLPELRLFVDGRREALQHNINPARTGDPARPVDTLIYSENARPLRIGALRIKPGDATFRGEIDELYIYPGAVSEDTVKNLFAEGTNQK